MMLPSTYKALQRATDRWKELWDYAQEQYVGNTRLIGFAKYGLELWWLAHKILEVAQREDAESSYMTHGPTDSLQELHDFIQRHQTRS
jgi:hypothetical protein